MKKSPCPRCGGQLFSWDDQDTSCLQCGHIEYGDRAQFGPGRLDLGKVRAALGIDAKPSLPPTRD